MNRLFHTNHHFHLYMENNIITEWNDFYKGTVLVDFLLLTSSHEYRLSLFLQFWSWYCADEKPSSIQENIKNLKQINVLAIGPHYNNSRPIISLKWYNLAIYIMGLVDTTRPEAICEGDTFRASFKQLLSQTVRDSNWPKFHSSSQNTAKASPAQIGFQLVSLREQHILLLDAEKGYRPIRIWIAHVMENTKRIGTKYGDKDTFLTTHRNIIFSPWFHLVSFQSYISTDTSQSQTRGTFHTLE